MSSIEESRRGWNAARWTAGDPRGHYESWFQRANHPTRARAFWIRYTIFSPEGRPGDALGELWAVAWDDEKRTIVAVKQEHSIRRCSFSKDELSAAIPGATLDASSLEGECQSNGHSVGWSLRYESPQAPLLLLDRPLYDAPLPKAKALVGSPNAIFNGTLRVDGAEWPIDDWSGSQNHNWGERHTDRYAWGQIAGFDEDPAAFLEVATAQVRLGPIMSPPLTVMVLRVGKAEYAFNALTDAVRAKGHYDYFQWRFESQHDFAHLSGTIAASAGDFVGLPYYNPPGGTRTCLNTKIASCHLTLRRRGEPLLSLSSRSRAAFEILTDDTDHGVSVLNSSGGR